MTGAMALFGAGAVSAAAGEASLRRSIVAFMFAGVGFIWRRPGALSLVPRTTPAPIRALIVGAALAAACPADITGGAERGAFK